MKKSVFAEIILPLSIQGTYTYLVPNDFPDQNLVGRRVIVQLGKSKLYTGIIKEVHNDSPKGFEAKPILSLIDENPILNEHHLMFWDWLSKYYMCNIGEVMHSALPAGLKLSGESVFRPNHTNIGISNVNDLECQFIKYLNEEGSLSLDEIRKGPFGIDGIQLAKQLSERKIILSEQNITEVYKPRKKSCIRLSAKYLNEEELSGLMDGLVRAPSQLKALEEFLALSGYDRGVFKHTDIEKNDLTSKGIPGQTISSLIKKGVFENYDVIISRIHNDVEAEKTAELPVLTEVQKKSFNEIKSGLKELPVALLQGVTSSGKTEIYIHLINEQLQKGNQVLYLLPEIAITTHIIKRLKLVFGEKVGVYHSKYSDNERTETYLNLAGTADKKPFDIILGVRSAIFLPFQNLGLVIIDEEHENTYKQFDPAPRYHARDASIVLAMYSAATVVLGSATPSFESLFNASAGKYGFSRLDERYGKVSLPKVVIADLAQAKKRKQLKTHFTPELVESLNETISKGKQAILFQNRRGYSSYLQCSACSYIMKCKSCDVSLTYHKYNHEMICHYCGYKTNVPVHCPECKDGNLLMRGFGTEKVEDEIARLFPEIGIGRLDLDKARSRKAFEKVISDFEESKIQILIGTQMVTKGLDFENVTLVGILDADSMLNFPDFRAFERGFQLMVQVSGRAGRRAEQGKVIVQTMDPSHPVIKDVLRGRADSFIDGQMNERKLFKYPPFVRMIRLSLRHEIPSILDAGAVFLAGELKATFGNRVLGPQQPMIARTHGKHIRQIILKIEKEASFEKAKELTSAILQYFSSNKVYRQIRVSIDVDPM